MNLYQERSSNIWRTAFLMAGFLIVVIAIGYAVAWYYQSSVILYVAIAFATGSEVGQALPPANPRI